MSARLLLLHKRTHKTSNCTARFRSYSERKRKLSSHLCIPAHTAQPCFAALLKHFVRARWWKQNMWTCSWQPTKAFEICLNQPYNVSLFAKQQSYGARYQPKLLKTSTANTRSAHNFHLSKIQALTRCEIILKLIHLHVCIQTLPHLHNSSPTKTRAAADHCERSREKIRLQLQQ